ncbi:hypothetical protein [Lederbergia panacisoli]|uniref:hypothetical protein n=1 Tax=Lederbergia panacisoli TaxID=1255251 RepID=UPI00214B9C19|nr:hypothetical protein [Lederbergia panacisoli]MCR2822681.1 hypothetical protein [Lederbergia panacisoli]
MKKTIVVLSILAILVISFWWTFHYVSRDGEFTKWGHGTVPIDFFDNGKAVFFGYDFTWEGIGKPILEKVEFIKRDGTMVEKDDNGFRIEPFIGKTRTIGSLSEEYVMEEGLDKDLVPFKGFQVDNGFYLVLRVEFHGQDADNDIEEMKITYKKYGITQLQYIPFENIFNDSN